MSPRALCVIVINTMVVAFLFVIKGVEALVNSCVNACVDREGGASACVLGGKGAHHCSDSFLCTHMSHHLL